MINWCRKLSLILFLVFYLLFSEINIVTRCYYKKRIFGNSPKLTLFFFHLLKLEIDEGTPSLPPSSPYTQFHHWPPKVSFCQQIHPIIQARVFLLAQLSGLKFQGVKSGSNSREWRLFGACLQPSADQRCEQPCGRKWKSGLWIEKSGNWQRQYSFRYFKFNSGSQKPLHGVEISAGRR